MMQASSDHNPETPDSQPAVQPPQRMKFTGSSGPLRNGSGVGGVGNASPRNSLIRRPAQIFVDADSDK